MKPRIGVMYAPGTNGHQEMVFAVELAGGAPEVVLLSDLLAGRKKLQDYKGLIFPGGFSYGDHIAAGRVLATKILAELAENLRGFLAADRPILGVCNGDQVLVEMGLLPGGSLGKRRAALTQNRSARFEGRWSSVRAAPGSFWTEGLGDKRLRLPVAHGEGRLVLDGAISTRPAFYYLDEAGCTTEAYPDNPSGSPAGVAGLNDASGLILGMMPHPERAVLPAHGSTDGLRLFENMVRHCLG